MRFGFGEAQFHLEPAVGCLFAHEPALPELAEYFVRVHPFPAKGRVCQRSHREIRVSMGCNIGIAGRIPGADIELHGWVDGLFTVDSRGRAQERLRAAVRTFDIDSFDDIHLQIVRDGSAEIIGLQELADHAGTFSREPPKQVPVVDVAESGAIQASTAFGRVYHFSDCPLELLYAYNDRLAVPVDCHQETGTFPA